MDPSHTSLSARLVVGSSLLSTAVPTRAAIYAGDRRGSKIRNRILWFLAAPAWFWYGNVTSIQHIRLLPDERRFQWSFNTHTIIRAWVDPLGLMIVISRRFHPANRKGPCDCLRQDFRARSVDLQ